MLALTMKKYADMLTVSEGTQFKQLIAAGTAPARKRTHARIKLERLHPPLQE